MYIFFSRVQTDVTLSRLYYPISSEFISKLSSRYNVYSKTYNGLELLELGARIQQIIWYVK